jgi:hypothetical protein
MLNRITIIAVIVFLAGCRKSDFNIPDSDGNVIKASVSGVGSTTWKKGTPYIIDGLVFVNPGQTLIIEPGVVVKARTGQGENASALIVARGGKIIAKGTKENPIIFTSEGDDLDGSIEIFARGLWGGLIILGDAPVNTPSGEASIEGIPLSEPRGIYGGTDSYSNSGILEYVSIRHGGTQLGEGDEINGLTLGGVGKGTRISHVEVISNKDDGVECFGGNVNLKNIVVAFCGDDAFDFDYGYRGRCQFVIAIQGKEVGDKLAEHDGGSGFLETITRPQIFNASFIGNGSSEVHNLITFTENGGGIYANSLFVNQSKGVEIEYEPGFSSWRLFELGDILFTGNEINGVSDGTLTSFALVVDKTGTILSDKTSQLAESVLNNNNAITDFGLGLFDNSIQLVPNSYVHENLYPYTDDWFDAVKFKGAIGPDDYWIDGWTLIDASGLLKENN